MADWTGVGLIYRARSTRPTSTFVGQPTMRTVVRAVRQHKPDNLAPLVNKGSHLTPDRGGVDVNEVAVRRGSGCGTARWSQAVNRRSMGLELLPEHFRAKPDR